MEKVKKRSGISLIVLVITILVMIILAGVVIVTMSENNPIEKAKEATFKESLSAIGEELDRFVANKVAEDAGFVKSSLHADISSCKYNTNTKDKTIYDVLPSLQSSKYKKQIQIEQGNLIYKTPNKKEVEWLKDMGVYYTGIVTGTVIIEGNTLIGVSPDYINTGVLVIPSNVTTIKAGAFAGCKDIVAVILPETVTEIPADCFNGCSKLQSVQMGSRVTKIGDRAFKWCTSLKDIQLADTVTSLGTETFRECKSLTEIKLSRDLDSIGSLCFYLCSGITKVDFPSKLNRIYNQAFQSTGIENVVLPASLQQIDYAAFLDCPNLKSIDFGNTPIIGTSIIRECPNVTTVKVAESNSNYKAVNNMLLNKQGTELIFSACGIVNAVVPATVETIGWEAFTGCIKMTSVQLPNTLKRIKGRAFERCTALTSLHIPASVIDVQMRIIEACPSLTSLTVDAENISFSAENNVLFDKNKTIIYAAADDKNTYKMPDTVTKLNDFAFTSCTKLESLEMSKKLYQVGNSAFYYCTGLKSLTFPASCKVIDEHAFRTCTALATLDLGSVESIGTNFIRGTTALKKLVIPATVTTIADGAFTNNFLSSLTVAPENATYEAEGNVVYNKAARSAIACAGDVKDIIVRGSANSVHNYAFEECHGVQTITIANGVTVIGARAFCDCSSLLKVNIPESVSVIDATAMQGSTRLAEIYIDKSKDTIKGAPWGATQGLKAVNWLKK